MTGEPVVIPLVISGDAKGAEAAVVGVDGKLRGLKGAYGDAKGGAEGFAAAQRGASAAARQGAETQERLRREIFQVNEALRSARSAYRSFGADQESARREALANIAALEQERAELQRLSRQAGATGSGVSRGASNASEAVHSLTRGFEDMTHAGGDVSLMLRYGGNNLAQFAQQMGYVARDAKATGQTMLSTLGAALRGPAGIIAGVSILISLLPTLISWLRRSGDASRDAARAVSEHRAEVYELIAAMQQAQGVAALSAISAARDEVDATNDRVRALNELQQAYLRAAESEQTLTTQGPGGQFVQRRVAGEVAITEQLRAQLIATGAMTAEEVAGLKTTVSRKKALAESAKLQGEIVNLNRVNRDTLEQIDAKEASISDRLDVQARQIRDRIEEMRGDPSRDEGEFQRLIDREEELEDAMRSRSEVATDIAKEQKRIAAAEKKLETARGAAARKAEEERRAAVQRVQALQGIEIEMMEASAEQVRATVALEFGRRREQLRQQFGVISSDLDAQIEALQQKATDAALAALAAQENAARLQGIDNRSVADQVARDTEGVPLSVRLDLEPRERRRAAEEIARGMGTVPVRAHLDLGSIEDQVDVKPLELLQAKAAAAADGIEHGLYTTIQQVDEAIRDLSSLKLSVDTDEERAELQKLIDKLEAVGAKMDEAGRKGWELSDVLQDAFAEATSALSALGSLFSVRAQNAADDYRAAVERDAAALEARGVAAEDAQAKAEAMNVAAARAMEQTAERQKALARVQVVVSTAAGIAKAFMDYGWPAGLLPASMIAATGALQLAAINAERAPSVSAGGGGGRGAGSQASDAQATVVVGRARAGASGAGASGAGTAGPVIPPVSTAALAAAPSRAASPSQPVNVSVTQGASEVERFEFETNWGRARVELRRQDARVQRLRG